MVGGKTVALKSKPPGKSAKAAKAKKESATNVKAKLKAGKAAKGKPGKANVAEVVEQLAQEMGPKTTRKRLLLKTPSDDTVYADPPPMPMQQPMPVASDLAVTEAGADSADIRPMKFLESLCDVATIAGAPFESKGIDVDDALADEISMGLRHGQIYLFTRKANYHVQEYITFGKFKKAFSTPSRKRSPISGARLFKDRCRLH